jgi:hypothetical protein
MEYLDDERGLSVTPSPRRSILRDAFQLGYVQIELRERGGVSYMESITIQHVRFPMANRVLTFLSKHVSEVEGKPSEPKWSTVFLDSPKTYALEVQA